MTKQLDWIAEGNIVLVAGQEGDIKRYRVVRVDGDGNVFARLQAPDSDGVMHDVAVDEDGNLLVHLRGDVTSSGPLNNSAIIKGSAGRVHWISFSDVAANTFTISDGTTALWRMTIPANGYGHIIFQGTLMCGTNILLTIAAPSATVSVTVGYE